MSLSAWGAIRLRFRHLRPSVITLHGALLLILLGALLTFTTAHKGYLHLREERCDLIVYKQGRLLLGNTFDFNTADDVAYFTLLAWKQLSLDQTRDRLYLAGEKSLRQPLTALLQTYIKNVLPYPFPSQLFRLGKETIDAPFELITIPLCGL